MAQRHPDRQAQRKASGSEKDRQYSRSVDCGQQETVAGHEREAIDYEREKHQPQARGDKPKRGGDTR